MGARSRRWIELEWFNKYSDESETYRIDPEASLGTAGVAKVNSYSDVLSEYRVHPEPKSLSPDGKPAGWHADGLLARRPVTASRRIIHIGKESNELEDIQAGTVHDPDEVLNEYVREDVWREFVLPVLQAMTRAQLRDAGLSGSSISRTRTGVFRGTARTRHRLTKVAGDFARAKLRDAGVVGPADPIDCCASLLQLQRRSGTSHKLI